MLKHKENKICLLCDKELRGRSDKKFCDDYCRAAYNNELKSVCNNYIRNVNNALIRNRRVLESLLPENRSTIKITRERLIEKGFQFKYHTHLYHTKNGSYFYCYEYGYLPLDNTWFLIVKKREE